MERLQTEVKSCSSVPTPFLNGTDFARFVVVGREQSNNVAWVRAFYFTGGVIGAPRFSMPTLEWTRNSQTVIERRMHEPIQ